MPDGHGRPSPPYSDDPPAGAGPATIQGEAGAFRDGFNRRPFLFPHGLRDNPMFTIPRLALAAETILERGDRGSFSAADATSFGVGTDFGTGLPRDRVAETVRRLGDARMWLKLSSVEQADPAYAELLDLIVRDLSELTGEDLASEITWSALTVFMASPGVVTPYHADHESNLLLQVAGEKDVCLFDGTDPEVLTAEEVERFYVGDPLAARYKPDLQERGEVHRLTPGIGLHHPPLWPHWVKNGDDVSVSVSVGFCLRSWDRRAKVHQANALLRGLGLRPPPPGRKPFQDRIKTAGLELVGKKGAVSREDVLFSGLGRVLAPLRAARSLRRRAAR